MHGPTGTVLLTREQLRQRLNERGYLLTTSYFNKLCLPSVSAGPPVAKWWGKRPLYTLEEGIVWAESRCTDTPGKLVSHPAEASA